MSRIQRRSIVTGMGVVSPLGPNLASFTEAVIEGRSGLEPISTFDPSPFRTFYGGEARCFDPTKSLSADEIDLLPDRYIQLALTAAREALASAGLAWSRENRPAKRTALVVGTCNGGLRTAEKQYRILLGKECGRFDRKMNLIIRYHAIGKALSHILGISGPTWVVTTACSSSTAALGVTMEMISSGCVDTVLVGGADALCIATMAGFDALKATSTGRTSPFSLPTGLNLGEGAAFWVVEEERAAKTRGAKAAGELLGYCLTSDAHHPTAPDPRGDGAFRTMSGALAMAGVSVEEIGCVNAHGTGTDVNDRTESKAVARLTQGRSVPVYSFKSQVGHCLGAAGAIEATAGLVSMQRGTVPATINFSEPRPGCTLDYVPNTPRSVAYDRFLSCNYAFGGNNAGAVIGLYDPKRPPAARPDRPTRTVLTGAGSVTSLGLGADALIDRLSKGERGLKPVDGRVRGFTRSKLAGIVDEFDSRDVDRRLDLKPMNLISRYATVAARLAMKEAGLRVSPQDGLATGVVTGVYVGPSEEDHMTAVIRSDGAESDLASFPQIVANATCGWVSNALSLKGYSCTVSQGADAGLFALLLAHLGIGSGSASRVLAGASDELYPRYFQNYDGLGLLHEGEDEQSFGLRLTTPDRRVLGEGAAYVVAEEIDEAIAREAPIAAEIVGYGMTTDAAKLYEPNLDPRGVAGAVDEALAKAGWRADDVGLVLWSPQGNLGDIKILDGLRLSLGGKADKVPLATTVFHTGLCEATSGTITLAAVLSCWAGQTPLWPEITGNEEIDRRPLPKGPVPTLSIAASDIGFNLALAIAPYQKERP